MGRKIAIGLTAIDVGVELFHVFVDPWLKNQIRSAIHMALGPNVKVRKRRAAVKQTEYNEMLNLESESYTYNVMKLLIYIMMSLLWTIVVLSCFVVLYPKEIWISFFR
jgi:hypothetical protein